MKCSDDQTGECAIGKEGCDFTGQRSFLPEKLVVFFFTVAE